MKVGLIGYESSGKSSLYRAAAGGTAKGDVAAVPVPDKRFDRIVAQVKPKKITPATVILHDDLEDARGAGGKLFSQRFLDEARQMEVLLLVVRAFESDMVPYHAAVDTARDLSGQEDEIFLSRRGRRVPARRTTLIESRSSGSSGLCPTALQSVLWS
jgi:ribosome-binding ATPase YchF (GTP1/OBG family)